MQENDNQFNGIKNKNGCMFGKLLEREVIFIKRNQETFKNDIIKKIDEDIRAPMKEQQNCINELKKSVHSSSWVPPFITAIVTGIIMGVIMLVVQGPFNG